MRPLPSCLVAVPTTTELLSRTTMTKWRLTQALMSRNSDIVINDKICYLSSIQREDGSGSSFNLVISHQGVKYNCYCRTTD